MRTPEEWGEVYADLGSAYERFASRLEDLLRNLLEDAELDYVTTQWATLTVEDFVDEIYINERDGIEVVDPFATRALHVADVRIVTKTKGDSAQICELLEREFEVDADLTLSFTDAEDGNTRLGVPGYLGRISYDFPRIVILLTPDRLALPEWREFNGMRAAIGVPTLLQRAWFEVDHNVIPYVYDWSFPPELRQTITAAAMHIAEADAAVSDLAETMSRIDDQYTQALERDELRGAIDLSAFEVYIRESETVATLVAAAEEAGMRPDEDSPYVSESYLALVKTCGFGSIRELDGFLQDGTARAGEIYRRLCEIVREQDDSTPWAGPLSVMEWLLLVLTRADAHTVALTRYRKEIEVALNTVIGNRVEG